MRDRFRAALAIAPAFLAGPALAHHAMDGDTPTTAVQGLLSGLAHPVIGLDHFAFVAGIGILSGLLPGGRALPVLFLVAGAFGTAMHLGGFELPGAELAVAISLLVMAAALWLHGRASLAAIAALCGAGGYVHGYVLAESIVGAEPSPLWAYLSGLAAVQIVIALGIGYATRVVVAHRPAALPRAAIAASAAVMLVGIVALPVWGG